MSLVPSGETSDMYPCNEKLSTLSGVVFTFVVNTNEATPLKQVSGQERGSRDSNNALELVHQMTQKLLRFYLFQTHLVVTTLIPLEMWEYSLMCLLVLKLIPLAGSLGSEMGGSIVDESHLRLSRKVCCLFLLSSFNLLYSCFTLSAGLSAKYQLKQVCSLNFYLHQLTLIPETCLKLYSTWKQQQIIILTLIVVLMPHYNHAAVLLDVQSACTDSQLHTYMNCEGLINLSVVVSFDLP